MYLQRELIRYALIDTLILTPPLSSLSLSLEIWAWITSARSSPEPSTDCTCYQSCEYRNHLLHIQWITFYHHSSKRDKRVSAWVDDIQRLEWWGLVTPDRLSYLLPRNCLKQITRRFWDGCTKEGGWENLIFPERPNIRSLKCLEQVLNSVFWTSFLVLFWFGFSWTARKEPHTLPKHTNTTGERQDRNWEMH